MLFRKTRTLPFRYTAIRRSAASRKASAGVQSIDCPVVAHPFGGDANQLQDLLGERIAQSIS